MREIPLLIYRSPIRHLFLPTKFHSGWVWGSDWNMQSRSIVCRTDLTDRPWCRFTLAATRIDPILVKFPKLPKLPYRFVFYPPSMNFSVSSEARPWPCFFILSEGILRLCALIGAWAIITCCFFADSLITGGTDFCFMLLLTSLILSIDLRSLDYLSTEVFSPDESFISERSDFYCLPDFFNLGELIFF